MIKFILACQDEDGGFADRPGDVVRHFSWLFYDRMRVIFVTHNTVIYSLYFRKLYDLLHLFPFVMRIIKYAQQNMYEYISDKQRKFF